MRLPNSISCLIVVTVLASACVPFFGPSPTTAPPVPSSTRALQATTATMTAAPSPTPISTATTPAAGGQAGPPRIQFPSGATTATIQGNLASNGMDSYVLQVPAGQTLTVNVSGQAHMLLQISGADGSPLKTYGAGGSNWSGRVPSTQDYAIGITTDDGSASSYTLQLALGSLAIPTANPPPKRIQFPPGGITTTVQGSLGANGVDVHVLRALAGQTMTVSVTSTQQVLLAVSGADGNVLKSSGAGTANWSGVLPTTQDYTITISTATGAPASYTLQITIPPRTP